MAELREVGLKYSPTVERAMKICFAAHKDQVDLSGLPYVFHPFHLAEQMETEDEICVALLHDVIEDSGCSLEDLERAGFSESIRTAVALLTHDRKTPYMDYIHRLKHNPLARKVKRADLKHNSDPNRYRPVSEMDYQRLEKYRAALAILDEMDRA